MAIFRGLACRLLVVALLLAAVQLRPSHVTIVDVDYAAPPSGPIVDVGSAPVVVVGTVLDRKSYWSDADRLIYTIATVQVARVERGSPAQEIKVRALGGTLPSGQGELVTHQPALQVGQQYRYFLSPLTGQEKYPYYDSSSEFYEVYGSDEGEQSSGQSTMVATAATCSAGYATLGSTWPTSSLPVPYKINANTSDLTGEETAVQAGFNTWSSDVLSAMSWTYSGATAIVGAANDGTNAVYWKTTANNLLAQTTTFSSGSDIVGFDIEVNDSYNWVNGAAANSYDVQSVSVHESGHALGLDHSTDPANVMYPTLAANSTFRNLGQGDQNGVRALYPFTTGTGWYLRDCNSAGSANITFSYGLSTDTHVAGDWNGDSVGSPGVVRLSGGALNWYLRNSNSGGSADYTFNYGVTGDIPIVGDWDGNGTWTIGVIRGTSYLLRNSNTSGSADFSFAYGASGDSFVTGDWDGNGTFTPGVKRGATWYLRNSNSAGSANLTFNYGTSTDTAMPGDFDGNGTTTVGVWRAGTWLFRNTNSAGSADLNFGYGSSTDEPLIGDWDGDLALSPAIIR